MDRMARPGKFRREDGEPEWNDQKGWPRKDHHDDSDQEDRAADHRDNQLSQRTRD